MDAIPEPSVDAAVKEPALTNPARRLHALLQSGRGTNPSTGMMDGLCSMFGLERADEPEIYTKLATFLRLLGTVERRCDAASDGKAHQFLHAIESVKRAFRSINPAATWTSAMGSISNSDMGLLYLAADYFDGLKEEALIDPETLREINVGVATLSAEIASGNLDEHLKVIILDQLDSIRQAIADYNIRGAEGLKKALAETTGMIVLEKDAFVKNKDDDSVKKFWEILTKINTAVRAAELAHYLGDAVAEAMKALTIIA